MGRVISMCALTAFALVVFPFAGKAQTPTRQLNPKITRPNCDLDLGFCLERASHISSEEKYTGHDEPALVFYSNVPGSGNSGVYLLKLPLDPPTLPLQDGGGTFNFQLHPAFWVGMTMCDTQSFPEFTKKCKPDSDENIFDSADPDSRHFIGKHPGTAFMELQFYPPGWVASPQLIDPQNYFAALNIFSVLQNGANGVLDNQDCQNKVGNEPGNFAVITQNGVPLSPPNALGVNFGRNKLDLNNVLSMAPGDQLLIILHDTHHGLEVIVYDLTNGQSGSMVASAANGFGQVLYQPSSPTCNVVPYNFHPMYSTSNEHTRVPWSVGTSNTSFTDELGHFEFCDAADPNTLNCLDPGIQDASSGLDADDTVCISAGGPFLPPPPFIQVGGCLQTESDFDGSSYGRNWPGTVANIKSDQRLHPQPIRFTSPLFFNSDGDLQNYNRVAFETDIPAFDPHCNAVTGEGCSVPAAGMKFYPFYTTSAGDRDDDACRWQLGGKLIPHTKNSFGGSATTAYGKPFFTLFLTGPNSATPFISVFHRGLDENPCSTSVDSIEDTIEHLTHD